MNMIEAPPTDSTAQRIEQAALELFYTQGFNATTVRQITESCGLTPGALYNHYPSKDVLLQSIVVRSQQRLGEGLDRALETTHNADALDRLHNLVSVFAAFHTQYGRESLVANSEWRSIQEPVQSEVLAAHRQVRDRFEMVIADGCKAGVFHLPPPGGEQTLKVTVLAIINIVLRIAAWYEPSGQMSADTVAELHAGLAVAMLTGRHGQRCEIATDRPPASSSSRLASVVARPIN